MGIIPYLNRPRKKVLVVPGLQVPASVVCPSQLFVSITPDLSSNERSVYIRLTHMTGSHILGRHIVKLELPSNNTPYDCAHYVCISSNHFGDGYLHTVRCTDVISGTRDAFTNTLKSLRLAHECPVAAVRVTPAAEYLEQSDIQLIDLPHGYCPAKA